MKEHKNTDRLSYPDCADPSTRYIPGNPDSAWELVNKYGTYNIQPTSDADNMYPAIHQGLPTQWKNLHQSKTDLFADNRD